MPSQHAKLSRPFFLTNILAVIALVFGVMTVFSGGSVLFGPGPAHDLAGNIFPLVVWFNFLAGFIYIFAAVGIWRGAYWALMLSFIIAAATAVVAIFFTYQVSQGATFEARTVGALILRIGFWSGVAGGLKYLGRTS